MTDDNIKSEKIQLIISIELHKSNSILSINNGLWSKVKQAIFMSEPMSDNIKIFAEKLSLRYYVNQGSPHDRADEGFVDDDHSVLLSFPIDK